MLLPGHPPQLHQQQPAELRCLPRAVHRYPGTGLPTLQSYLPGGVAGAPPELPLLHPGQAGQVSLIILCYYNLRIC